MVLSETKWKIVKIEGLKGIFKIEDDKGNLVVCRVSKNKMKFPKGVNPPEYVVEEIEHFLENSGMLICSDIGCTYGVSSERDNLKERGYVMCNHCKGVVHNMSRGMIKGKQIGEGYFVKSFCKLNLK